MLLQLYTASHNKPFLIIPDSQPQRKRIDFGATKKAAICCVIRRLFLRDEEAPSLKDTLVEQGTNGPV